MAIVGLVVLTGAGLLNLLTEDHCARIISRFGVAFGSRRAAATANACPPAVEATGTGAV